MIRKWGLWVLAVGMMLCVPGRAQRTDIRELVRQRSTLAYGQDRLYDFSVPALTPSPEGYEPCYISHYGRHGSRYAYTARTYTCLLEMLQKGAKEGNLTERGEEMLAAVEPFVKKISYRVGDLTRKGWEQQRGIAAVMLASFPQAFPEGAAIDACTSPSLRSALSMTACCLALGQLRPDLQLYEHQSTEDLPATRPNFSNPLAPESIAPPCPTQESVASFFDRTTDWKALLSPFFKDPSTALIQYPSWETLVYLYMFQAGLQSLDNDLGASIPPLFSPEELATLWEADNYNRYREFYNYLGPCCTIWDDMVAKADEAIQEGKRGASLRFGHDHCLLPLLMIGCLAGQGHFPDRTEDVALWFQTIHAPMSGNIQLVLYRPTNGDGPLRVKVLLNGEETAVEGLSCTDGCYDWEAFKAHLAAREALFVKR